MDTRGSSEKTKRSVTVTCSNFAFYVHSQLDKAMIKKPSKKAEKIFSDNLPQGNYRIFLDCKTLSPTKIWEENGGASYSPNVAYLAHWGGGWQWSKVFSHFPPLKRRCVLWSHVSYSPKKYSISCEPPDLPDH